MLSYQANHNKNNREKKSDPKKLAMEKNGLWAVPLMLSTLTSIRVSVQDSTANAEAELSGRRRQMLFQRDLRCRAGRTQTSCL